MAVDPSKSIINDASMSLKLINFEFCGVVLFLLGKVVYITGIATVVVPAVALHCDVAFYVAYSAVVAGAHLG